MGQCGKEDTKQYKIGEILYKEEPIEINSGKEAVELIVINEGDRPIQVGSHYHFFECNFALKFDREEAFGRHLDIPSGTAARFDPSEEKKVALVHYSGEEKIMGFNELTMGRVWDSAVKEAALIRMHLREKEGRSRW